MRKLVLTAALVFGLTNVLQPVLMTSTVEAASVKTFKDIEGHWARSGVEALVATGAIHGYEDGTFRPQATITRAEFSKILSVLMKASSNDLAFPAMKGHWAASSVNGLKAKGVIVPSEYPNGYNPNRNITRLEMSKMISRGLASENSSWKTILNELENLDFINIPFNDKNVMTV